MTPMGAADGDDLPAVALQARVLSGTAPLLLPFQPEVLDRIPASICAVDGDRRICYLNPAWLAFAVANGASGVPESCGLGKNVLFAVPPVLRPFHENMYAQARASGQPVEHEYKCSSSTHQRVFRMRIYPCSSDALVVVHSLVHEKPHSQAPSACLEDMYRDARGMIAQCSNCRRVRRAGTGEGIGSQWDWVPEYVARMPPRITHGICPVCLDFYYPT